MKKERKIISTYNNVYSVNNFANIATIKISEIIIKKKSQIIKINLNNNNIKDNIIKWK